MNLFFETLFGQYADYASIDIFLDMPKRPQAPKPIFWALEYEYSGNQVPKFEECQKNGTCAP